METTVDLLRAVHPGTPAKPQRPPRTWSSRTILLWIHTALAASLSCGAGGAHAQTSEVLVGNHGQTFQTAAAVLPDGTAQGFRTGPNDAG